MKPGRQIFFLFTVTNVWGSNCFSRIKDERGWGYTMLTQFNLFYANLQLQNNRMVFDLVFESGVW